MKHITFRQQQTLDFIKSFISKMGYPPSVREIAVGINSESSSTAYNLVNKLIEKGFIKHVPGQVRSLRIVEQQADPRDQTIVELLDFIKSLHQLSNDPITKEQCRLAIENAYATK